MVEQEVATNMAKLKPVKGADKKPNYARDAKGAIPCLILVIGIIVLLGFLFSAMLKTAS